MILMNDVESRQAYPHADQGFTPKSSKNMSANGYDSPIKDGCYF